MRLPYLGEGGILVQQSGASGILRYKHVESSNPEGCIFSAQLQGAKSGSLYKEMRAAVWKKTWGILNLKHL